ncbi:MAG: DUF481 domain-containing protein [Myxococcota bacterium]|nr:DUF481 domain-containing protein [Myxococcota bacterium]
MSRRTRIAIASLVAAGGLLVTTRSADAQIVNVQGQLAKPPETDGVTAQAELKLDWREGNNPLFDVGGTGSVLVRHGRFLGLAVARGGYGKSRGLTLTRRSFEHVRARVTLDCRWRWEAFAQHEYDAFRRLSVRAIVGTGPALQIVATKDIGILAGAAYMFELEHLDDRAGTSDAGDRSVAHRASFYVTGTETLGSGVSIAETIYVQPRFDDPSDVRLLAEVSVTSKLTKRIALSDALIVAYDRTPPDGIKRYDTQLRVSVLVTF